MENFKINTNLYIPSTPNVEQQLKETQASENYIQSVIPSSSDIAASISMPGDSIVDLINQIEKYNAESEALLAQSNSEISTIGSYQFDQRAAINDIAKKLNPKAPTLKSSASGAYLGTVGELERYSSSDNFKIFGFNSALGEEQEYKYGRAMTWGDTLGKAFAGGGAIAADTFIEGWKGWGRMAEALYTWDSSKLMGSKEERYEIAKQQEAIFNKYAIYNTAESEDSLLNRQFFGNMLQQAGFTIGAFGQMIVENYLTAGIGKAISASVGMFAKAKGLSTAMNVGELINDTRKAQQVISNTQRVNNALKQIPRALVPLFGTIEDAVKAGKAGAGTLQLGMIGLGGIKRELSIFNMARSEAIFEAASTYKEMEDKLLKEFINTNGRQPTNTELENIRKTADDASSDNFASNLGILTLMNRIQFGNMFKNFNTSKKIFSKNAAAFADDVFEVSGKVGGKIVTKVYEKGFIGRLGSVGDIAKTFGKKKAAWEASKSMGLGLMKFEGSEGAQELIQEASNKGLSQYHYDLYHGKKGYGSKLDNVLESIQNPITDIDGAKTFLMGALTGRFIAPVSYAGGKIFGGKQAQEIAAQKRQAIDVINSFYSDPTQYTKEWIANVKVQNKAAETMEQAVANGDKYTFYNAKDSAFAKAISSAIKLNMYESLKDTMNELGKNLSDTEFKEAFNMDASETSRQGVSEFMNNVTQQMDDYFTLYTNLKDKYGDRIVPELYRYNKPEEYENVKISKIALDNAIEMLTTNVYKARQSTKRAVQLQREMAANINIGASSIEVLNKLGSEQSINDHVDILQKEVSFYESVDTLSPEQRKEFNRKKQELKLAEGWKNAFEDVMTGQGESYFDPKTIREIYAAYEELVNFYNKSEEKNVAVSIEDIEDNFSKFLDYIQLNKDNKAYIDAMNILADPYNISLIIEATKSSLKEIGTRNQKEHIQEVQAITEDKIEEPAELIELVEEAKYPDLPSINKPEEPAPSAPEQSLNKEQKAALEKAYQEAYAKYKQDAEAAGNSIANYGQWKDFSVAAKDIRKKFDLGGVSEKKEPETYVENFDVATVNTENISTDVVDEILSSRESKKSDNFDSNTDEFFTNLTVCNI
jgi:hypothetical protein